MGHIISTEGLKPDPVKIEAILEMKSPNNVQALQQFLGMVTYLGKFIADLSDKTKPLRKLLETQTVWTWTEIEQNVLKS